MPRKHGIHHSLCLKVTIKSTYRMIKQIYVIVIKPILHIKSRVLVSIKLTTTTHLNVYCTFFMESSLLYFVSNERSPANSLLRRSTSKFQSPSIMSDEELAILYYSVVVVVNVWCVCVGVSLFFFGKILPL